jgi:hypothetical protein
MRSRAPETANIDKKIDLGFGAIQLLGSGFAALYLGDITNQLAIDDLRNNAPVARVAIEGLISFASFTTAGGCLYGSARAFRRLVSFS